MKKILEQTLLKKCEWPRSTRTCDYHQWSSGKCNTEMLDHRPEVSHRVKTGSTSWSHQCGATTALLWYRQGYIVYSHLGNVLMFSLKI